MVKKPKQQFFSCRWKGLCQVAQRQGRSREPRVGQLLLACLFVCLLACMHACHKRFPDIEVEAVQEWTTTRAFLFKGLLDLPCPRPRLNSFPTHDTKCSCAWKPVRKQRKRHRPVTWVAVYGDTQAVVPQKTWLALNQPESAYCLRERPFRAACTFANIFW